MFTPNVLGPVALSLLLIGSLSHSATAQTARRCCLPDETCQVMTAKQCNDNGGVWRFDEPLCDGADPCPFPYQGVGMSMTAARRLVREKTVHTLWVQDPMATYAADYVFWGLLDPSGSAMVIAPQIVVDLRNYQGTGLADHAANTAAALRQQVATAKAIWDTAAHADPTDPEETLPFYWAVRFDALGIGFDWSEGPGKLPSFSNHKCDVLPGKLSRQRYIDHPGRVVSASGSPATTIELSAVYSDNPSTFYEQFPLNYFEEPWPATMIIEGEEPQEITGFDPDAGTVTVSPGFSGNIENAEFRIVRTDPNPHGALFPCYFFKNGAEELETWVVAFCSAMQSEMAGEDWPENVGGPVAVIVGDEDLNLLGVDYLNYYNDYLQSPRASDPEFKIDATHTLQQWDFDYAKDSGGVRFDQYDFMPQVAEYSPLNKDVRSYLICTLQTAYNYHRHLSTWQHLQQLWPKAHLSQYLLGDNYGVKLGEDPPLAVPAGPAEGWFHGTRKWAGTVAWDVYNCITNPVPWRSIAADGGCLPVFHASASTFEGTIAETNTSEYYEIVVDSVGTVDVGDFLDRDFELFVRFTGGNNGGRIIRVTEWELATHTITLEDPLILPVNDEEPFVLFFPSDPYVDYIDSAGVAEWPLIETFCDRYAQPIDEEGFRATAIKWAAEQARAQTLAMPKHRYTVYCGPGSVTNWFPPDEGSLPDWYDGQDEQVSFAATYPHSPMTCQDGWLNSGDWQQITAQAMDYGVNDFVWFIPEFHLAPTTADVVLWPALLNVALTYNMHFPAYKEIACIADWDMDGIVEEHDMTKFTTAWLASSLETDFDNDGNRDENGDLVLDAEDLATFEDAFNSGVCGDVVAFPIPENCDADWDEDGDVGVPDIFAFLSDWFAQVTEARCYGGTCDVPAIFAFLTVWFATGIGECES